MFKVNFYSRLMPFHLSTKTDPSFQDRCQVHFKVLLFVQTKVSHHCSSIPRAHQIYEPLLQTLIWNKLVQELKSIKVYDHRTLLESFLQSRSFGFLLTRQTLWLEFQPYHYSKDECLDKTDWTQTKYYSCNHLPLLGSLQILISVSLNRSKS